MATEQKKVPIVLSMMRRRQQQRVMRFWLHRAFTVNMLIRKMPEQKMQELFIKAKYL